MKNAAELIAALSAPNHLNVALDAWEIEQQKAGIGLKRLSDVMEEKLITNVPDFAAMSQDDLTQWWADIQTTLEDVMS